VTEAWYRRFPTASRTLPSVASTSMAPTGSPDGAGDGTGTDTVWRPLASKDRSRWRS
jgi:hypothetical protein